MPSRSSPRASARVVTAQSARRETRVGSSARRTGLASPVRARDPKAPSSRHLAPRQGRVRQPAPVAGFTTRVVSTNGIGLAVRDEGSGPAVVLCHGFPELAYSWRHQVPALVDAGFRVLAPDQRGYGGSSRPDAIEAYDM